MALCSLSTGSTCTPLARAAVMTASPAMTRISLLATAMSLPALDRRQRRAQSAGADDGDEHDVRLAASAASSTRPRRRREFRARSPERARAQFPELRFVDKANRLRAGIRCACAAQSGGVAMRGEADEFASDRADRAPPSRRFRRWSRSPQHDDAFAAHTIGETQPQKIKQRRGEEHAIDRSSMPPMPGKRAPESFTPVARLKSDSTRSPTTAASPSPSPHDRRTSVSGDSLAGKSNTKETLPMAATAAPDKTLPRFPGTDARNHLVLPDRLPSK